MDILKLKNDIKRARLKEGAIEREIISVIIPSLFVGQNFDTSKLIPSRFLICHRVKCPCIE